MKLKKDIIQFPKLIFDLENAFGLPVMLLRTLIFRARAFILIGKVEDTADFVSAIALRFDVLGRPWMSKIVDLSLLIASIASCYLSQGSIILGVSRRYSSVRQSDLI